MPVSFYFLPLAIPSRMRILKASEVEKPRLKSSLRAAMMSASSTLRMETLYRAYVFLWYFAVASSWASDVFFMIFSFWFILTPR